MRIRVGLWTRIDQLMIIGIVAVPAQICVVILLFRRIFSVQEIIMVMFATALGILALFITYKSFKGCYIRWVKGIDSNLLEEKISEALQSLGIVYSDLRKGDKKQVRRGIIIFRQVYVLPSGIEIGLSAGRKRECTIVIGPVKHENDTQAMKVIEIIDDVIDRCCS